jgi:hypothetical protein
VMKLFILITCKEHIPLSACINKMMLLLPLLFGRVVINLPVTLVDSVQQCPHIMCGVTPSHDRPFFQTVLSCLLKASVPNMRGIEREKAHIMANIVNAVLTYQLNRSFRLSLRLLRSFQGLVLSKRQKLEYPSRTQLNMNGT